MSKRQRIEALELDTAELHAAQHNSAKLIGYLEGRVLALEQAAKAQPEPFAQSKAKALHHASSCYLSLGLPCNCQAQPEPVTPAKPGRWKPGNNENFWWTDIHGEQTCCTPSFLTKKFFDRLVATGNCHPTEAAAKYADDRAVALQAMHDWADARFVPDWEDFSQTKFAMSYNYRLKAWDVNDWHEVVISDWPVFATEADFTEFMAEFGDRMHFLLERTKP